MFTVKTDIETCKMNMALMQRQYTSLPGRMYEGKIFINNDV